MKALLLLITTLVSTATPFADYWYAGKAEVAVYDLEQSRYGHNRSGTATLIFVTEPFSKSKHVKLDEPSKAGKDRATVLKLNTVKKYNTGIYPYSVMVSAFSDVNTGYLYKATTSVQEWCGHVFMQANAKGENDYQYKGYSYFESEGDESGTLRNTTLAEEVMLNIRLGKLTPEVTTLTLTPTQELARTLHFQPKPCDVQLTWKTDKKTTSVQLTYQHPLAINTTITFDNQFPYTIQSWSETYTKGGKTYTTKATLKSINLFPYWNMNSPDFDGTRKEIGLED